MHQTPPEADPQPAFADQLAMRQLRHQTKNALQRIISQVETRASLAGSAGSRALAEDVRRRIMLTASIADALFGLTASPGALADRLQLLGESVIALLGDPDQVLRLAVAAEATCRPGLDSVLLRIAHEFLGNAVKHGMHQRLTGRIEIEVIERDGTVRLRVRDDGWGCGAFPAPGEGLRVARALARQAGGWIEMRRDGLTTLAECLLPSPPARLDS